MHDLASRSSVSSVGPTGMKKEAWSPCRLRLNRSYSNMAGSCMGPRCFRPQDRLEGDWCPSGAPETTRADGRGGGPSKFASFHEE